MGKGKSVVVGYRYYMGVHAALCHGPVDEVSELIGGERSAWTGSVTESSSVSIDALSLFGGDDREGGFFGVLDILMGEPTQAVNAYLNDKIDGVVPAYRGIVSAVFRGPNASVAGTSSRGFQWSAMNPYFKAPWFRLRRVLKGWSRGSPWYPEKAVINGLDMNAAHIVYECYTDQNWGMGYSPDDIDDVNFKAVADRLFDEGFGLSMLWYEQDSIGNFIDHVLRHVDGVRRYDIRTGKLQIKLIRDDYVIADLPELNASNIIELSSFQRTAWGDTTNEVTVKYTDREQNVATVTVQNLASVDAQNAVVGVTKEYPGIREGSLAARVAMRDLVTVSSPLAKVSLQCKRIAWDWLEGDTFRLLWSPLGINGVPFRIIKIDKGTLIDGVIKIDAVEDVFKTPDNAYVATPQTAWTDPRSLPLPVTAYKLLEAPYWDVSRKMTSADFDYLQPGWAFAEFLAGKPTSDAMYFSLQNSPTNSTYTQVQSTAHFAPIATLSVPVPVAASDFNVQVTDGSDLDLIEVGDYFYIDNEAFGVVSITGSGITASRGILDTVPAAHAAGAKLFFVTDDQASDSTERSTGETTYYKALTTTGRGTLPLNSASAVAITMVGRAHKPYPPGNLRVNNIVYPAQVLTTDGVVISFSHRDRLQQTVDLVPTTTGNIGPEPGTTYDLTVRDGTNTIIGTYNGITSPYTVPVALTNTAKTMTVEIVSKVAGVTSWQALRHTFSIVTP